MKSHGDFETRSAVDLREVGLHNYARDPSTDVWCFAHAIGDEEPALWTPGDPPPQRLFDHIASGGRFYAWNAGFELEIWNEIMVPRYGWPALPLEQTYCSMAEALAMSMPGALEDAAPALGIRFLKDTEGRALMMRMTRPRAPTGKALQDWLQTREPGKLVWWDEPEKRTRLGEYCKQDVRVERAAGERTMSLSDRERHLWIVDRKINLRGVKLDVEAVHGAIEIAEAVKAECDAAMARLTDGKVKTVTAIQALKDWMAEQGVPVESLNKQAVVDLLNEGSDETVPDSLPPQVRKALLLRQESGKASTAKFDVMAATMGVDGRLRHLYQYHGAMSGRWAGRKVQAHNLPRDMPPPDVVEKIITLVRRRDWRAIDMIYGPPLTMLSKCLRSFFVAVPGTKLISGDWSNVEGRGQAWFAGEQWKLDAFRAADEKRGPGLYELAYARMFNVPVETVKNPSEERQIGKVSELAFGYQGGVDSFRTMAKAYPEISGKISDAQADAFKHAWRAAHPRITAVWREIQNAATAAVMSPGDKFSCGYPGRQATYRMVGSFLWCLLPSGRVICYPYPKILEGDYGPQLTYMCAPSPEDHKKGKIIYDKSNAANWARIGTYGGVLFNNIVQGFCRDFLADLLLWLDEMGAAIVLHTHDDANIEVHDAKAEGARKAMEDRMCLVPDWAAGFPLFAKCSILERYGK